MMEIFMQQAMWSNNGRRHYVEVLEDAEISTPDKVNGQSSPGYGVYKIESLETWLEENFNSQIVNDDFIVSDKVRYKIVKSSELLPHPNQSKESYSVIKLKDF
jgi:hypothetical protein